MFGPTTVEVGALFVAERLFGLAFDFREAVPERQRELDPIGAWQP